MRTSVAARFAFGGIGSPLGITKSGDAAAAATSGSSERLTTNSVTVTPTGGFAPDTFNWVVVSGSFSIDSPTSATTSFTETVASGSSDVGMATCHVRSPDGQVASINVTVSLSVAAPNPPVWSVPDGTNMGTFPRGGSTQFIDLYASSVGGVAYSVFSQFSYPSGFGPVVNFSGSPGTGGPGTGHVQGAASSDCPPGTYEAVVAATNIADGSQSAISISITVT